MARIFALIASGMRSGMVVQLRRQAGDVDVLELQRENLARQGAAGDDEDFSRAVLAAGKARLGEAVGGGQGHVTVAK